MPCFILYKNNNVFNYFKRYFNFKFINLNISMKDKK